MLQFHITHCLSGHQLVALEDHGAEIPVTSFHLSQSSLQMKMVVAFIVLTYYNRETTFWKVMLIFHK